MLILLLCLRNLLRSGSIWTFLGSWIRISMNLCGSETLVSTPVHVFWFRYIRDYYRTGLAGLPCSEYIILGCGQGCGSVLIFCWYGFRFFWADPDPAKWKKRIRIQPYKICKKLNQCILSPKKVKRLLKSRFRSQAGSGNFLIRSRLRLLGNGNIIWQIVKRRPSLTRMKIIFYVYLREDIK